MLNRHRVASLFHYFSDKFSFDWAFGSDTSSRASPLKRKSFRVSRHLLNKNGDENSALRRRWENHLWRSINKAVEGVVWKSRQRWWNGTSSTVNTPVVWAPLANCASRYCWRPSGVMTSLPINPRGLWVASWLRITMNNGRENYRNDIRPSSLMDRARGSPHLCPD